MVAGPFYILYRKRKNLRFSQPLLPSPSSSTVIVTNDFHCLRAGLIAGKCGYTDSSTLAAKQFLLTTPAAASVLFSPGPCPPEQMAVTWGWANINSAAVSIRAWSESEGVSPRTCAPRIIIWETFGDGSFFALSHGGTARYDKINGIHAVFHQYYFFYLFYNNSSLLRNSNLLFMVLALSRNMLLRICTASEPRGRTGSGKIRPFSCPPADHTVPWMRMGTGGAAG